MAPMEAPTDPAIRQYSLLPDRLGEVERRMRRQILFPQVAVTTVLLVISLFFGIRAGGGTTYIIVSAMVISGSLTYSLFIGPRRFHKG